MFKPSVRTAGTIKLIPADMISPNPNQPRRYFNRDTLLGLAESIEQNGLIQPIAVRPLETGRFELIAGERRLRAAQLAGLRAVPCIEHQVGPRDSAVLALLENLQREDLNMFEGAEGVARLMGEWGISRQETAQRLGWAQSTLSNKLRLLQLDDIQQRTILEHRLTERHARALLRLEAEKRCGALRVIIERGFNVRDAEEYIDSLLESAQLQFEPPPTKPRRIGLVRDVRLFVNTINHAVEVMRGQGLDARSTQSESEDFIEYRVVIPKTAAIFRQTARGKGGTPQA